MSIALNVSAGDVIDSYATLVSEVSAWLDRDDLNARIPGFVRLCEARLNRVLRTPDMEATANFSTSDEDTALPADFLAMRAIHIEGTRDKPLRALSPGAIAIEYSGAAGCPSAFAVLGRSLKLVPPPVAATSLQMVYFARLVPLSDATPSNWLLAQSPDVYLYGALLQSAAFIDDPQRVGQWKAAYDEALAEVQSAGSRSRWGASPLVPNTVRQVRGVRS